MTRRAETVWSPEPAPDWFRRARDRRGAAALEFSIIASVLVLCLLFLIGCGAMVWSRNAVLIVAAQTARCMAIDSPDCSSPDNDPQTYAKNRLGRWGVTRILSATSPTITSSYTSCGYSSGTFAQVTISGDATGLTSILTSPWAGRRVSATACFPKAAK